MIFFSGHENPFIFFRGKEGNIWIKRINKFPRKIAEIMKKRGIFWQVSFLVALYKLCFIFLKS